MEAIRVGETLLRAQPLLPFLAPTTYRAPSQAVSRQCRVSRIPVECQNRAFTTSRLRAAATNPSDSRQDEGSRQQSRSQQPKDDLSSLLDNALDFTKGPPTASTQRTSRFKSPSAQSRNPPSRSPDGNAFTDLLAAMRTPLSTRKSESSVSSFPDIGRMLDPQNNLAPSLPPKLDKPSLKLGPSVGRTIAVDGSKGMDVGRAFRSLEMACARNAVRRDFQRQRFHERPGLKRKRLHSERWRRRFKEGFRGVVRMVNRMKKQGW